MKSREKHLEPCCHVKAGAKVYVVYRVERWIKKNGNYVLTGYADQPLCLECCNILA